MATNEIKCRLNAKLVDNAFDPAVCPTRIYSDHHYPVE